MKIGLSWAKHTISEIKRVGRVNGQLALCGLSFPFIQAELILSFRKASCGPALAIQWFAGHQRS